MFANLFEMYLAAERAGVNAVNVVQAIHDRPTHDNILKRGPGIGGYCLTKDGLLMVWALAEFFGMNKDEFNLVARAIILNDMSPLHMIRLASEALSSLGEN